MKKIILSAVFLIYCATIALACPDAAPVPQSNEEEPVMHLVLWQKDGAQVFFNLAKNPTISYEGEKVIIESSRVVEYDFQSIKKMTYVEKVPDGIKEITINDEMPFINDGGVITFLSADKDLNVSVYLINGMLIKQFVVNKNEPCAISLNSSLGNIYLVNVNGVTYKIYIR